MRDEYPKVQWTTKTAIDINLGTQGGFAIAAAMRGPDSMQIYQLKQALTGRFRHLTTGVTSAKYLGGYSVNTEPVSDEDVEVLEAEVRQLVDRGFNVIHYLGHIREGADHLAALFVAAEPDRADEAHQLGALAWRLQGVAVNHANKVVSNQ